MDKMEIEEESSDKNQVNIKKETFVNIGRALRDCYEFTKNLGKGGYGKVFQVRNKKSGQLYACKKLSKLNVNNLIKFRREINILVKMDHPNIIKLYDVFESQNSLYLIMEECHGGELFDRILKRIESNEMYSEKEACEIIQQVMSAIEYCHKQGIVHRDLKPENLLYLREGPELNNPLKIIDFGLSQEININKILSSKVGTAYYVSPEILQGKYSEKCDVWAAGVILYVLLSGEPPFNGPSDGVIYSKIRQFKFNFPEKRWSKISNDAKDLLSKMLVPEAQRLSASQVLEHPWFQLVKDNKIPLEKIKLDGNSNFFKEYKESNKLKKIVLLYMASKLQEEEILDLNKLFKAFDEDNDGQIDYKEFEQGIMRLNSKGIKKEEIQSMFDEIDSDNNKKIDYTEFIAATLQKNVFLKKEKLFDAFSALDTDKNGKIAKDDLMGVLKLQPQHDKFVTELIKSADKNGDGYIDYKEFVDMMEYNNENV
jgi:calcium-dependent protein kinase